MRRNTHLTYLELKQLKTLHTHLIKAYPFGKRLEVCYAPLRYLRRSTSRCTCSPRSPRQEIPIRITPEPVQQEDTWRVGQLPPEVEPVVEVVSHVFKGLLNRMIAA